MTGHDRNPFEQDTALLTVEALCQTLHVEVTTLTEFIDLGLAMPQAGAGGGAISAIEAERLSRALRLSRELELHAAAAALMVELLEEREGLQRRLRVLERALGLPG